MGLFATTIVNEYHGFVSPA